MQSERRVMKTAVILAAGRGKKLWPYSDYWPKAAIPVAGRANIIRLVESLRQCEIENIIVVGGYLDQRLRYALRRYDQITFISSAPLEGTAPALHAAIRTVSDEQVLVVYGDVYLPKAVVKNFVTRARSENDITLVLGKPLNGDRAQDWICADTSEDKRVRAIYGHPRPHYVSHRIMGLFALSTTAVKPYLQTNPGFMVHVNVGAMPPLESHLEQSIQMMVEDGHSVCIEDCDSSVVDIDKPWHIMEACQSALLQEVATIDQTVIPQSCSIHPSATITGHVVLGERVTIGRNVYIKGNAVIGAGSVIDNGATIGANCCIGQDCKIEDFCKIGEYSVIGNRNRIGHCAEFAGVTFDKVSFTHYGEVYGVVGESTDIAAGVTIGILRFDDLSQQQKTAGRSEAVTPFGNAIFIGDFARTGIASLFMPGVKVGSNCVIGSGVLVTEDIPSQSLIYVEQKTIRKDWGSSRYGW